MRADGVLQVILNVALFHDMNVERSQEKFVRLFAFEENNSTPVQFTIKLPNPNAANDIQSYNGHNTASHPTDVFSSNRCHGLSCL
ncbi:2412_t:CDS:2, partial [Acaulospora morrowiae]